MQKGTRERNVHIHKLMEHDYAETIRMRELTQDRREETHHHHHQIVDIHNSFSHPLSLSFD